MKTKTFKYKLYINIIILICVKKKILRSLCSWTVFFLHKPNIYLENGIWKKITVKACKKKKKK